VDDGSSDQTAVLVAANDDPRIRLVRQARAGVSAARNAGLRIAAGQSPPPQAILFLDADDWLAPTALQTLAAAYADVPCAVAVGARYVRVHTDGARTTSAAPPQGLVLPRLLTRNRFVNGGQLLISANAAAEAGPFRTDLHYGEDWEYWCRLALLGAFAAARDPRPVLFVREHEGSACHTLATSADAYRQALDAIHANPVLQERLGRTHLARLRRKAEAEIAWAVGRELVRHGSLRDGRRSLLNALAGAPSLKRACMLPLSFIGSGPFRSYRVGA
jgi:glycosyltransferase involved in cell wall biosynthesis